MILGRLAPQIGPPPRRDIDLKERRSVVPGGRYLLVDAAVSQGVRRIDEHLHQGRRGVAGRTALVAVVHEAHVGGDDVEVYLLHSWCTFLPEGFVLILEAVECSDRVERSIRYVAAARKAKKVALLRAHFRTDFQSSRSLNEQYPQSLLPYNHSTLCKRHPRQKTPLQHGKRRG